jgi:hypothetical protein
MIFENAKTVDGDKDFVTKEEALAFGEIAPLDRLQNQIRLARDLFEKMKEIDLFIFPTKQSYESSSSSIKQCLPYLKPIIVSNSHIYNEYIYKDFIFKYDNYDSVDILYDKIKEILDTDPKIIETLMHKQKDFVYENTY